MTARGAPRRKAQDRAIELRRIRADELLALAERIAAAPGRRELVDWLHQVAADDQAFIERRQRERQVERTMKPTELEAANGITWQRYAGICRANHRMMVSGRPTELWIRAVAHPTALRPYYVVLPGGEILERKFSLLVDAKAAAVAAWLAELAAEFN
jgi:hypothetical protein